MGSLSSRKVARRGARRVTLGDGNEALIIENRPPMSPTGLVGTVHHDRLVRFDRKAAARGAAFARAENIDGVDAEILYTLNVHAVLARHPRDEGYKAMIHAYNQWLIEEYCAHSPQRLIAMAVIRIPVWLMRFRNWSCQEIWFQRRRTAALPSARDTRR